MMIVTCSNAENGGNYSKLLGVPTASFCIGQPSGQNFSNVASQVLTDHHCPLPAR